MKQSSVSAEIVEPYAEALFSLAQDNNLTEQIGNDVRFLLELVESSTELNDFLVNPFVQADSKKAALQQLTQSNIQDYCFKFIMLLVDRRRIFLLEAICKQYQALLRKLNNTVLAEVVSTVELNDHQREQVMAKVQQMTQAAQVELSTSIDADLLGGVIIKVGSQVLDASLRGQLRRISNSLTGSAV